MKRLLLLVLLSLLQTCHSQTTSSDSLKTANAEFDQQILDIIDNYEEEGYDFIILRVYDTLWSFENRCRFLMRKDTCTQRFGLSMDYDYSIHHVTISYIDDYYNYERPCHDEISEIEGHFGDSENHIKTDRLDSLYYENSPYTVYGKIKGKYLYEVFDPTSVSEPYSGMLYKAIHPY